MQKIINRYTCTKQSSWVLSSNQPMLMDREDDPVEVMAALNADVTELVGDGGHPLALLPTLAGRYFLVWNEDEGQGYDAAFSYVFTNDGDFRLLLNSLIKETFGDYRLLIGIYQPGVLSGQAITTGDTLAFYDVEASQSGKTAQEIAGTLDAKNPAVDYRLREVYTWDTLYVNVATGINPQGLWWQSS